MIIFGREGREERGTLLKRTLGGESEHVASGVWQQSMMNRSKEMEARGYTGFCRAETLTYLHALLLIYEHGLNLYTPLLPPLYMPSLLVKHRIQVGALSSTYTL